MLLNIDNDKIINLSKKLKNKLSADELSVKLLMILIK